jgi:hypothetical protein
MLPFTPNVTITNHRQATQAKNRIPRDVWIFMQEYHRRFITPMVTWYSMNRECTGRTDNYTLDMYRGNRYVLDKSSLDPMTCGLNVTLNTHNGL